MRISDWSADVCSSDLAAEQARAYGRAGQDQARARPPEPRRAARCRTRARRDDGAECAITDRRVSRGRGGHGAGDDQARRHRARSEEHTSELQSLMRISYAVFCLKKKNKKRPNHNETTPDTQIQMHHAKSKTANNSI